MIRLDIKANGFHPDRTRAWPNLDFETTVDLNFDTTDALHKLRQAFNLLRKEGLSVHMRYVCCSSCGLPEAPFFCSLIYVLREDELAFKSVGVLPVYFRCANGSDRRGTRALGDQVRIALEMSGLKVEWSGNPDQAILVMA